MNQCEIFKKNVNLIYITAHMTQSSHPAKHIRDKNSVFFEKNK